MVCISWPDYNQCWLSSFHQTPMIIGLGQAEHVTHASLNIT